ncbi:MAG: radical SAM family heme chaperone HemW [Eubacterium sp.]|nr:radical SAM family heme chaperone HemW [Eubacterium sp.]
MKKNKGLGLYIHIPFCARKCNYCDFLSFPCGERQMEDYLDALDREFFLWQETLEQRPLETIFIGGGTPSLLSVLQAEKLMQIIHRHCNLKDLKEFSIECNPNSLTREKIQVYREFLVNRISLGMQSSVNEELALLGRLHTREEFEKAYDLVRQETDCQVNVDLMAAIPAQTIASYKESLSYVTDLEPDHISAYSLIVEEGTPFYEKYGIEPPVDEDTDRTMYELTKSFLRDKGYERYEISNYAKKGRECQHNLKYWRRQDYLGLGLGAASCLGDKRFSNVRDLGAYEDLVGQGKRPIDQEEILSLQDQMSEFMYLGMRCVKGVSTKDFARDFNRDLEEVYGDVLWNYEKMDLLKKEGDYWSLTEAGIDVSNQIFADFI